ncbi:DUF4232 domain-containing protein [Streptomyces sp. NPDC054861]
MRTFDIRRTTIAGALLAAALTTSACGAAETGKTPSAGASGKTSTATVAPTAPTSPGPSASDGTSAGGTATGGSTTPGSGTGGTKGRQTSDSSGGKGSAGQQGGGAEAVTCTGGTTRVTVKRPARPINHLLLTTTNSGSVPCDLYGAPLLRFDQEQSATAIDEATRPQSVIRLAPGESAYASVVLTGERAGSEAHGRTATRLEVHFAGRETAGSVGPSATLGLPSGTYKTDDAKVMYWTTSFEDALSY